MFNTRLAPLCAALIGAFATFGAHAWTVPDPTNDGSPNPTTVSKGWMDDGTGRSVPIPADSWYSGAKAIDMTQKQPVIPLPDYVTGLRPWTSYFVGQSKCYTEFCATIRSDYAVEITPLNGAITMPGAAPQGVMDAPIANQKVVLRASGNNCANGAEIRAYANTYNPYTSTPTAWGADVSYAGGCDASGGP